MSSRSFRTIPESATRTWTLAGMNLSATPATDAAFDTMYESPIIRISLSVEFLSGRDIENLRYILDEDTFIPEWEFADESWNKLIEGVTGVVTAYNKTVIERARELNLSSTSVIGKAKTTYDVQLVSEKSTLDPRRQPDDIPTPQNRVETVYEPSIRSSSSRRSSTVKLDPLTSWLAGTRRATRRV